MTTVVTPSKLIKTPTFDGECSAYARVQRRKALAAVYKLSDDGASIVLDAEIDTTDGAWTRLVAALPLNDVRWVALSLPYTVDGGGKRDKLAMITWCPDALQRATHRETIEVKSGAVML
eukprot:CAMPEP_0198308752 /NCGR_PEP_ID=MMETSP1450-20131203/1329_1 /TAXON_ID=753684 ORGANISM="Madagascaria erythrocladiodes, Strain CCMP3234" /NCGR_SAMPLE_ID=MMETSP1450 /ASSEMBLY_ACC=CAM_ASM_001115 /LENGTH=118 /DNA_ID=CAMNT_0044011455 /DNA_START=186 /DNA_END=539 /DNA_ORIENTATION=+